MVDPSETTPLLPAVSGNQDEFPSIFSAAELLPKEISLFDFQNAYPHSLGQVQPLRAVAFRLLLILHLLVSEESKYTLSGQHNTVEALEKLHEHDRRRQNLRHIASAILGYVPAAITDAGLHGANEGIPEDVSVEHILLASFFVRPLSPRKLRVLDLLAHSAIPAEILRDPIISLSLVRLWKFGTARLPAEPSLLQKFWRLYDASSAPRVVHTVHLAAHLAYLVLLAHLILNPSPPPILTNAPGGPIGFREPYIAIYSISDIAFDPWSLSSLPDILVLFSLLCSLPASPSPGTGAYLILLPALCIHVLFLSFPRCPSPLLLLEPAQWFPSSSLYVVYLRRCLLPAFVFLSPALGVSIVLLSLSLSDTISNLQAIGVAALPAARVAFLALLFIACFLFLHFSTSIPLLPPSPVRRGENTYRWNWEKYGADIGFEGRRSLARAVLTYSPGPYNLAYPPPLNMLALPLAVLPRVSHKASNLAWRLVVGPFALLTAVLWTWRLF